MTQDADNREVVRALQQLTTAADNFVNRAPRVKRIDPERVGLLEAITHAELVLSVHRLKQGSEPATRSKHSLPEARNKATKRRVMN